MERKSVVKIISAALALSLPLIFGCPFYELFGVPCPACGVTRAWLCFFRADLRGAFKHHLFFLFIPLFIILYILYDNGLCGRYARIVKISFYIFAAALFSYHVLRLCL